MHQTDLCQLPVFFGKLGIHGGQGLAFRLRILDVLLQRLADDFRDCLAALGGDRTALQPQRVRYDSPRGFHDMASTRIVFTLA
jgi:hypothetical protein